MEQIEKILELWKEDSVIDQTEPSRELLRIPTLHSKYIDLLVHYKMASKKAHFKFLEMKRKKWEYYSGKMSRDDLEELGWEPFPFTLKSDIQLYLESDKDLIELTARKSLHDETVSVIESILNELKQRTWQLKEYINWEKFVSGG